MLKTGPQSSACVPPIQMLLWFLVTDEQARVNYDDLDCSSYQLHDTQADAVG